MQKVISKIEEYTKESLSITTIDTTNGILLWAGGAPLCELTSDGIIPVLTLEVTILPLMAIKVYEAFMIEYANLRLDTTYRWLNPEGKTFYGREAETEYLRYEMLRTIKANQILDSQKLMLT